MRITAQGRCGLCISKGSSGWRSLCTTTTSIRRPPRLSISRPRYSVTPMMFSMSWSGRLKAAALMLEQCRERGFLEQYYPEIQYRFTELYYGVTLFSYMLGCPRRKLSFVRELGRGMRETFPDFQENAYYRQYTDPEEQRMIALQMRSDARFFYYYGLKVWVRGVKKFVRARLRG